MNCTKIENKEKCETVLDQNGLRSCRYNYTTKKCEDLPKEYQLPATQKSGLMSGIDKEDKEQDKKEIPSDIEELFSRHNTSIQEPYLSNMARLISAVMKCNNRDDWVFVNRYLISKKDDTIYYTTYHKYFYYNGINMMGTTEDLVFFVKKLLCGEKVLLSWFYNIDGKNGNTYDIDKNILDMIKIDEYVGFFRKITEQKWTLNNLYKLYTKNKLKNINTEITEMYKDKFLKILEFTTSCIYTDEYEDVPSILNYIKYFLKDKPFVDEPKIMNYFCNIAKNTKKYLSDFLTWSTRSRKVTYKLKDTSDLEPSKKYTVKTVDNELGDKLFIKRDMKYYADYLNKRCDDPDYGPIAAAMIVEGAVVKDIPVSYLERSFFEIKRKIQSIHDELLPHYRGELPLYTEIFYEYQRRNFSESCRAYSEGTYNFIADNYLFGGCNCECGTYLLTYIQSLYPDNKWDYYSVTLPEHIYGLVKNKKSRKVFHIETTSLNMWIHKNSKNVVSATTSQYNNMLLFFSKSVSSERRISVKKIYKFDMIVLIFLYKRYMGIDIISENLTKYNYIDYLQPKDVIKLSKNIISRDIVTYKNMSDVFWVYWCILHLAIKPHINKGTARQDEKKDDDNGRKLRSIAKCIKMITQETNEYLQKHLFR